MANQAGPLGDALLRYHSFEGDVFAALPPHAPLNLVQDMAYIRRGAPPHFRPRPPAPQEWVASSVGGQMSERGQVLLVAGSDADSAAGAPSDALHLVFEDCHHLLLRSPADEWQVRSVLDSSYACEVMLGVVSGALPEWRFAPVTLDAATVGEIARRATAVFATVYGKDTFLMWRREG